MTQGKNLHIEEQNYQESEKLGEIRGVPEYCVEKYLLFKGGRVVYVFLRAAVKK